MVSFLTRMTVLQKIGLALLIVAVLLYILVRYENSPKAKVPLVFSQKELLSTLWQAYKSDNIESGSNRTLDKQQNNITTSEGESYTMLRAVWMDDQATFDASYKWTTDILQHKNDHLFSWQFGQLPDKKYGVLTNQGGQNAASDADSDIALALLFAHEKWGNQYYLDQAKLIIKDIYKNEVVTINGKPILVADDVEQFSSSRVVINPSYFAPYSYRLFAIVDPQDNWKGVIDSSYDILQQTTTMQLNGVNGTLPPNWVEMDHHSGSIRAVTDNSSLTTQYSYDALRIPWRIALDWQWYQEPRAKSYLDSLSFFEQQWQAHGKLSTVYNHDGSAPTILESPAMYGGVIGYFMTSDPADAKNVYAQKLQLLYDPDTNAWRKVLSYYDDNWAWFGIAMYNNLLPNLGSTITSQEAK